MSRPQLEQAFLAQFPGAEAFLDGLKIRMNALTPIHLRRIDALVRIYGAEAAAQAIQRASEYRNFNAVAIERILQARFPNVVGEGAVQPASGNLQALGALDDVDSGSPQDYTLDVQEPTPGGEDEPKE
jgi:hypothetical protein